MRLNRICAIASVPGVALFLALLLSGEASGQLQLEASDPQLMGYTNLLGQGLSFVDFNLDGWDDLTVPNASGEILFFAGGPNGFVPVTLGISASLGRPMSVMWLDIDNDGDRDFLFTSSMTISALGGYSQFASSQVWINEDGVFVNRTQEWGWDTLENKPCMGKSFHDWNGDGDLDVVISQYALPCAGQWMHDNVFMEHSGDSFDDVSSTVGIANGYSPTFQSAWIDLNDDSWTDLFLINDSGVEGCPSPNEAFMNQAGIAFSQVSSTIGLDVVMSSMSCTIGDPDADGEEEIFVTNQSMTDFYTYSQETSAYFDRDSSIAFTELSSLVGLNLDRWSWSAMWVDVDMDGWDDLMVATSPFSVSGSSDVEVYDNYMMMNAGAMNSDGTVAFAEDTTNWPGRGLLLFSLVRGDIDHDGDPDVIGIGSGPSLAVWNNKVDETHPDRHGLTVSVCGTESNSEAIGTRLVLYSSGHRQQRTLRAGEDLYAQHSTTQFFGLGESSVADSLEIFWPDGDRQVHFGLTADSSYQFIEHSEAFEVSLVSQSGNQATLMLNVPPKFTGILWGGMATDTLLWTAQIGEPLDYSAQWFHGLYELTGLVEWDELLGDFSGCTSEDADNYDPLAVVDDGSCILSDFCGEGTQWSVGDQQCIVVNVSCPQDIDGDGIVGVSDVLEILGYYGEICMEVVD